MLTRAMAAVIAVIAGCAGVQEGAGASSSAPASSGELFPALLTARIAWTGEVRLAKLRVWADRGYRADNAQWQQLVEEQVAYANRVLIPMLGVGFAAEYRAWEHHAQRGQLAVDLAALVRTDPGDDVMWVVGLTAAAGAESTSFEQIGGSQLAHVIVRGYPERAQRMALERAFTAASADERREALIARRRHHTTAALLHHLAHSLGALHEAEPDAFMNVTYSPAVRALIGQANHRRMASAMDERLAAATQHHEAEQLLERGDAVGAAAALAPVLRLYPARVEPRVLRCKVELARSGAQHASAIAACDEASAIGIESAVAVAAARRGAGDIERAHRTLVAVEAQLASVPPDNAATTWLVLAGEYREIGALTRAEGSLARAGTGAADHRITALISTARARYGIPRDGSRWNLTIDDEPFAVIAVRDAVSLVNASKWDAAVKAIDAAERRWPTLPGVLTARCALEFQRDDIAAARRFCERAVAQGGSSWALHLLGTMELDARRGRTAAAVAHLREAVARDPDLVQAWRTLGRALGRMRAIAELEQLRRDYRAHFNAPLPH